MMSYFQVNRIVVNNSIAVKFLPLFYHYIDINKTSKLTIFICYHLLLLVLFCLVTVLAEHVTDIVICKFSHCPTISNIRSSV